MYQPVPPSYRIILVIRGSPEMRKFYKKTMRDSKVDRKWLMGMCRNFLFSILEELAGDNPKPKYYELSDYYDNSRTTITASDEEAVVWLEKLLLRKQEQIKARREAERRELNG